MIDKYLTEQEMGSILKKEDKKVPCENLKNESKTVYI
jgi:hypothetical protein